MPNPQAQQRVPSRAFQREKPIAFASPPSFGVWSQERHRHGLQSACPRLPIVMHRTHFARPSTSISPQKAGRELCVSATNNGDSKPGSLRARCAALERRSLLRRPCAATRTTIGPAKSDAYAACELAFGAVSSAPTFADARAKHVPIASEIATTIGPLASDGDSRFARASLPGVCKRNAKVPAYP